MSDPVPCPCATRRSSVRREKRFSTRTSVDLVVTATPLVTHAWMCRTPNVATLHRRTPIGAQHATLGEPCEVAADPEAHAIVQDALQPSSRPPALVGLATQHTALVAPRVKRRKLGPVLSSVGHEQRQWVREQSKVELPVPAARRIVERRERHRRVAETVQRKLKAVLALGTVDKHERTAVPRQRLEQPREQDD
eukprot:508556-Prymnesium_polylepis.1